MVSNVGNTGMFLQNLQLGTPHRQLAPLQSAASSETALVYGDWTTPADCCEIKCKEADIYQYRHIDDDVVDVNVSVMLRTQRRSTE